MQTGHFSGNGNAGSLCAATHRRFRKALAVLSATSITGALLTLAAPPVHAALVEAGAGAVLTGTWSEDRGSAAEENPALAAGCFGFTTKTDASWAQAGTYTAGIVGAVYAGETTARLSSTADYRFDTLSTYSPTASCSGLPFGVQVPSEAPGLHRIAAHVEIEDTDPNLSAGSVSCSLDGDFSRTAVTVVTITASGTCTVNGIVTAVTHTWVLNAVAVPSGFPPTLSVLVSGGSYVEDSPIPPPPPAPSPPADSTCSNTDPDGASGNDSSSSTADGSCMEESASSVNTADYEVRRAQGGTGGANSPAAMEEADNSLVAASCTDDHPEPPSERVWKRGCSFVRELVDSVPEYKFYSEELWGAAHAKDPFPQDLEYRLRRVKVRSQVSGANVRWVNADPLSDADVADGGSRTVDWSFDLPVKGLSVGSSTSSSMATYSGEIHPFVDNNQLYHVSWRAKDYDDRLDPSRTQSTRGALMWRLPEGPQPFNSVFTLQAWTCLYEAELAGPCERT